MGWSPFRALLVLQQGVPGSQTHLPKCLSAGLFCGSSFLCLLGAAVEEHGLQEGGWSEFAQGQPHGDPQCP